ncbi:ABC transporter permease [Microbacteriaceae bacterium 4G12]
MSSRLFYKRLLYEWKGKWGAIRSVVDWTIALYAVIPILVFSGMYYASLWKELPDWTAYLPLRFLLVILYAYSSQRTVRSFLEQADSLFLIQYKAFIRGIVLRGMLCSFLRVCLTNIILIVVLLPFLLRKFHFTYVQLVVFFLFFTLIRYIALFVNRYLELRLMRRWMEQVARGFATSIGILLFTSGVLLSRISVFYIIPYFLLLSALLYILIREKMKYQHFFDREVEKERRELLRWAGAILMRGGHIQKPVRAKKPYIFPRSKRLWKRQDAPSRIVEAFLKEYFRTEKNIKLYGLIVFFSAIGIFVLPHWVAYLVIMFALFALFHISRDEWKVFAGKMFIRLYCPEGEIVLLAQKARGYVLIPALIVYGIVFASLFSIWASVLLGVLFIILTIYYLFVPK